MHIPRAAWRTTQQQELVQPHSSPFEQSWARGSWGPLSWATPQSCDPNEGQAASSSQRIWVGWQSHLRPERLSGVFTASSSWQSSLTAGALHLCSDTWKTCHPEYWELLKVWNSEAMRSFCLGYCFSWFEKCDLTPFMQLFENDKERPFKYQSHSKLGHLY